MRLLRVVLLSVLLYVGFAIGRPAAPVVPSAARASAAFDANTATDAWLATLPAAGKQRSDSYFEGKEWLVVWSYLWLAVTMMILLWSGFSARLRDISERIVSRPFLQGWCYFALLAIAAAVLELPLTLYEGFWRERQYGLMNQTFADWARDELIGFALTLIFGGIVVSVLMTIVRKLPRTWHLWGLLVTVVFVVIGMVIGPVFIAPLFNKYTPLGDAAIKHPVLALAHANGIPVTEVYQVNASKQSNRVSAFVTGFGGTERIVLNDNLLNRVSPQGILSVMGHEMGHYVMHHIFDAVLFFTLVFAVMFFILRWALEWGVARFGGRWRVRGVGDFAILPWAFLVLATLDFIATPIDNTFIRTQEEEADLYGLNAARQPDGEAEVDLLLGEYRKLNPGPLEEWIFFDHPSGRHRIFDAMRWKAENLCEFDPKLPCRAQVPPNAQ